MSPFTPEKAEAREILAILSDLHERVRGFSLPMAKEGLSDMAKAFGRSPEEIRSAEMAKVPLGKMSNPAEIAALVEFLVCGNQASMTRQSLDINGGAFMI